MHSRIRPLRNYPDRQMQPGVRFFVLAIDFLHISILDLVARRFDLRQYGLIQTTARCSVIREEKLLSAGKSRSKSVPATSLMRRALHRRKYHLLLCCHPEDCCE